MKEVEITEELLTRLTDEQADWTAAILQSHEYGDDGGDYTNSALDCMRVLFNMRWDQADLASLDVWLNTPYDNTIGELKLPSGTSAVQLYDCACDGVCQALWDLDCPALPKEDN